MLWILPPEFVVFTGFGLNIYRQAVKTVDEIFRQV